MKTTRILLSALLAGTIIAMPVAQVWATSGDKSTQNSNSNSSSSSSSSSSSGSGSSSSSSSSSGSGSSSSSSSSSGSSGAWQVGGAATNQATTTAADLQKHVATTAAWIGAISSTISFGIAWIPETMPSVLSWLDGLVTAVFPTGGPVAWGLNFDVVGAAVDGWAVYDAYNRKSKLSEEPEEMTAAVRNIGSSDELEGECEDDTEGTCNEVSAKLDGTEVHVATLKNVGLEALEDVAGSILITPEELLTAASVIKDGFGTTTTEVTTEVNGEKVTTSRTLTDEQRKNIDLRKSGHLQLTGTAGVARADLGTTVAESERDQYSRLSSYVGSGDGVIANVKVLCGLDLTLAQRLNLLNMLYGQQAANEAASALQQLQDK